MQKADDGKVEELVTEVVERCKKMGHRVTRPRVRRFVEEQLLKDMIGENPCKEIDLEQAQLQRVVEEYKKKWLKGMDSNTFAQWYTSQWDEDK